MSIKSGFSINLGKSIKVIDELWKDVLFWASKRVSIKKDWTRFSGTGGIPFKAMKLLQTVVSVMLSVIISWFISSRSREVKKQTSADQPIIITSKGKSSRFAWRSKPCPCACAGVGED